MKIISLNIGQAKTLDWKGKSVTTGIFKRPTDQAVELLAETLAGDVQVDRRFHGGTYKSVYAYPFEHYAYWQNELQREDLDLGMFGENLTTAGLLEEEVCIGDQFEVGSCVLEATQPRVPCMKLGLRFNDASMVRRFLKAARNGIYFKVVQQGRMQKGDAIKRIDKSAYNITIAQIGKAYAKPQDHMDWVKEIVEIPILPPKLRPDFEKWLQ
ncbi:MAG: MOSC domain-containing protein [Bacteroidota bacterium]